MGVKKKTSSLVYSFCHMDLLASNSTVEKEQDWLHAKYPASRFSFDLPWKIEGERSKETLLAGYTPSGNESEKKTQIIGTVYMDQT